MVENAAVVFDVDGVLLHLTDAESELFFKPFERYLDTSSLSRDWNSYRIRNDSDITDEILKLNGISSELKPTILQDYLNLLNQSLNDQVIQTIQVSGAALLLSKLAGKLRMGIATANFREAAKLRLQTVDMWDPVKHFAFGADGGGHKYEILGRARQALNLPPARIVYIGDNINDVKAGHHNGVNFIGFSEDAERRKQLASAGATHVTSNHAENLALISEMLGLSL
jgi:HAD superfamily hydrolase (TIGR01549 family)